MSIVEIWVENDWVVKTLLIALGVVFVIVFEKSYQYYRAHRVLKKLQDIESINELSDLPNGFAKETLLEIDSFNAKSESLFNSYVGVKLDMYEQYMMKYVTVVGVIAILAPMLGLIGTFIGVWHVFDGIGNISLSDPSVIARGIKEVIVDTMSGLIVAVIAMIFYKSFEYISFKNVSKFEEKVYRLIREK